MKRSQFGARDDAIVCWPGNRKIKRKKNQKSPDKSVIQILFLSFDLGKQ